MSRPPATSLPALARIALGAVGAVCAALISPLLSAAPASAAGPLTFLSTLAGPSQANMYPSGLQYDAVNNRLVVADTGRDRILLYSLTGTKLGEFGSYGTGNGQFASPRDVAVDGAGNIYVGDAENNRIQKFSSAGVWQWTRGGLPNALEAPCPEAPAANDCSLNTPIGLSWDAANNVLLVGSNGQNLVKAWDANGLFKWKSPTAAVLGFNSPRDVSRGPDGRMWVTSYNTHQIKVYDVSADGLTWNPTPHWVLGDGLDNGHGDGQLNYPYNVAFSPDGNTVYVSDTGTGRIARWDISGASPVWLPQYGERCAAHPQPCADPPADQGRFNHLRRVTVDSAGRVYGADFWGAGIEVFQPDPSDNLNTSPTHTSVLSIEGFEPPLPGVAEAYGVDVAPNGQIYVMDRLNHRIQRFLPDGTFVNAVGARGTQPATFSWPEALTVGPDGSVWAVDTRGDRFEKFPANLATTPTVPSFGSTGTATGQFNYPEGADVGPDGTVYIADTRNNRIQRFNPTTQTFLTPIGSAGSGNGQLSQPMGVAVTATNIFVADTLNNRVQKLDLSGTFVASYSTGLSGPEGIEVAPDGTVWVADTQNSRLVHLSASLSDLGDGFGSLGSGDYQFFDPHDLAFGNGKMYVADTYNNRVQVFDYSGVVPPPTFDPTYKSQISNAGGHALIYPAGIAISSTGTWYVADSGGSRIATIDPVTDQVTTVTATGLTDPRDLELDVSSGTSLWVTDTGGNRLVKMSLAGVQQATITGLNQPYGLTNDATRVYVANTYGNNVRAYTKSTNALAWTQTTCNGLAFSRPRDVGLAGNGSILVADTDNDRIVVLNASTGACVSWFGSTGANAGQFKSPRSVTSDGGTGIWVADAFNYRIQHLTMTGTSLGVTPVSYGEGATQFRSAHCVSRVPGTTRVAVCDTFNFRIAVYDGAGATPTLVDTIAGVKPTNGGFNGPFGVAYGPAGELYVADWFNHRIQKFNPDGSFDRTWGFYGTQNGSLIFPRNVLVDGDGNVVVTDSENNRIDVFSPTGTYLRQIKPPTGSALSRPYQVALDGTGGYWVADTNNSRVVHLSSTGAVIGAPFAVAGKPEGIVLDTDGTLIVSNTQNNAVQRYSATGTLLGTLLGAGTSTTVQKPGGLLLTGTGTAKRLWVTDEGGGRVIVLDSTFAVLKIFGTPGSGNGQLKTPRGIAVDPTDGDIAVADFGNDRVSIWSPTAGQPPVDVAAPGVAVTSPTEGASVPNATVQVSGTATDDISVASVGVSVQRASDGTFLQGNGTWGAGEVYSAAVLAQPGATSTTWTFSVPVSATGGYTLKARATDTAAKTTTATRTFTVQSGGTDTVDPTAAVTGPANNATVIGTQVTMAGTAADNVGVSEVRVSVKDRTSGLWLQSNGTWGSTASAYRTATLGSPGAANTTWTLTLALPVGDYGFSAKAVDTSARVGLASTWTQFQLRSGDTVPADGTMTSPANNATVPFGPVTLSGMATDDVAVGSVKLGIQNTVTKQWLRPDGTFQTAYTTVTATLGSPGATSTTWSFVFNPPTSVKYGVSVIATDTNGNVDATKPWNTFTVSP